MVDKANIYCYNCYLLDNLYDFKYCLLNEKGLINKMNNTNLGNKTDYTN